MLERLVAQKVYALLRDFKLNVGLFEIARFAFLLPVAPLGALGFIIAEHAIQRFLIPLRLEIAFLQQPLNQPVNQLLQPLIACLTVFVKELVVLLLIQRPLVIRLLAPVKLRLTEQLQELPALRRVIHCAPRV